MSNSSNSRYDAVVIGAGHNGLAAAATLAGHGKTVCVIERAETIGGMSKTAPLAPGIRAPQIAHLLYNLSPAVMHELGLGKARPFQTRLLDTVSLAPDGRHVLIRGNKASFADGGAPHPDAAGFAALRDRLTRFAALLGRMADHAPPALAGGLTDGATLRELARLARLGLGLKRMGKKDMREFLRVILSNAHDLILDEMPDGPLAGALAADAVRGAYAGPRSPGTVFSLMYRLGNGGAIHLPLGGMGAVPDAFADAARARGVDILTGVGVSRVLVAADIVHGVALDDGRTIQTDAVLTSSGAFAAMQMAGVEHFDTETTRRLRNLRNKGTAAKVNLVLSGAPTFTGLTPEQTAQRLLIAPASAYVECAFNPAKYGEMSTAPVIEAVIPTLTDSSLAGDGHHVLSAVTQYAPHALSGGWTDAARDRLLQITLAALEAHAPGIGKLVEHAQVLSPVDIEQQTGAPAGHWHHAEMGIDQILTLRPANRVAHYRFGPGGYYLCGASAHPGGDVMGAAGRNAALQLIADKGAS
jgi:phytoene dehydrogenase-like protein